jgi:hypothetical protein
MLLMLPMLRTLVVIEVRTWVFHQHPLLSTRGDMTILDRLCREQLPGRKVRSWILTLFHQRSLQPFPSLRRNSSTNTDFRWLHSQHLYLHKEPLPLHCSRMDLPPSANQVLLNSHARACRRLLVQRWASSRNLEWRDALLCRVRNVRLNNPRPL